MKKSKLFSLSKAVVTAAILFLQGTSVNAQEHSGAVARLTRYEVKPEYKTLFRSAVSEYVSYSLNQDGNILSEAYYEQDNGAVVWIIERWTSITALQKAQKHQSFNTVTALSPMALTQPAKTIAVRDLEPVSKEQWRTDAESNDRPFLIMLFVDCRPGTENNFRDIYHTAMPQFRSEPGVINYQLSQFEDDSTQFVTYEKFRSKDAFQYHLDFPPIQPVIDYLNSSIRQQPFQKGLHKLIPF